MNLLKLRIKVGVDMSGTRSKWIARVTQHVYNAIQTLDRGPTVFVTYNSPAKSTPVFVNGGDSCTLKAGSRGEVEHDRPSFVLSTQVALA